MLGNDLIWGWNVLGGGVGSEMRWMFWDRAYELQVRTTCITYSKNGDWVDQVYDFISKFHIYLIICMMLFGEFGTNDFGINWYL